MKQTFLVWAFLCLCCTFSTASFSKLDSLGQPIVQTLSKSSIVGGFSIMSLFEESPSFHKEHFVIGLGYGFKNNIDVSNKESKIQVPPIALSFERPILKNVGLGISMGIMRWAFDRDKETVFGYYTFSPTLAYHLNLGDKIDFYSGVAVTARLSAVKRNEGGGWFKKTKFGVGIFSGMRYYFHSRVGGFLEYGNHNVACFRAGLVYRFGN